MRTFEVKRRIESEFLKRNESKCKKDNIASILFLTSESAKHMAAVEHYQRPRHKVKKYYKTPTMV